MPVTEIGNESKNFRARRRTGNDFGKVQIPRRIEEVRAQKVLAEFVGIAFGDSRERNAAGVGGDDRARRAVRDDFVVKRPFDRDIFRDRFDDPVAVFDFGEVIVEGAGSYQARAFGGEESTWAALERSIHAIACRLIAQFLVR